mmetsp:Transcript_66597/g.168741  ORF Transcript_66597/g.168741 Transcript_66597/m.168741 type:complete len:333 (+) Transcript_66597:45-1043(+)
MLLSMSRCRAQCTLTRHDERNTITRLVLCHAERPPSATRGPGRQRAPFSRKLQPTRPALSAQHTRPAASSPTEEAQAPWHAVIISMNVGFKLAPPTRKPSMSCFARSSAQFSGVTLPPYWIRTFSATSALTAVLRYSRIEACVSCAWSGVATLPVPIAHTGSYAMTMSSQLVILDRTAANCRWLTSSVLPVSRSSKSSPMQNMTLMPAFWQISSLAAVISSVSPYLVRRSEWPMRVHSIAMSLRCSAFHSPVKAPMPVALTFWEQTAMPRASRSGLTVEMCKAVGQITTSILPASKGVSFHAASSFCASLSVAGLHFQLPPTMNLRGMLFDC